MARTPSNMLDLGTLAPPFKLKDVSTGEIVNEKLGQEKGLCLIFMCNHCPFVIHVIEELVRITNDFNGEIKFVAISSNDVENYPQDSPEKMKVFKQENGMNFPYLYDEDQSIAKAYDAACTPDFYLFDKELSLAYRGQMDDSRPGNEAPINGKDLRMAINQLINGENISSEQKPSVGCNIKWK
jgi:peroxiredoxin